MAEDEALAPKPVERVVERVEVRDPTQGQVTKALHQYLANTGVTVETIMKLVEPKVEAAVERVVDRLVASKKLDELLVAALMSHLRGEKMLFDKDLGGNGYGFHNRIRDLVLRQLTALVLADYEVVVRPRPKPETP